MNEGAPDASRSLIGSALANGRYAVSGVLGKGSQGTTLEAIDKRDGTLVAIKRFQVRGARSWKDVELAEREARVLSRLSHPLLPAAITHFEEDGALYLVMDRIEGKTLAQRGQRSRDEVIRFLHDADRVLTYLHSQSPPVIHRDIKPSNVIVRPERNGTASHVLVDFGSVRDSLKPTGGSTVVGTFGYMAPEQFQGRARPQSDVYAVGATALAMLTGKQPEELPHRGLAIDVRATLPTDEAMARVLERMVEPNPDIRPVRILPLLGALTEGEVPSPGDRSGRNHAWRERRRGPRGASEHRAPETHPPGASPVAGSSPSGPVSPPSTGPLPAIVLPIVVIALSMARVTVMLTLRVFVPTLLTLLSMLFGPALKRAGRAVGRAGIVADAALHRATAHVMGRGAKAAQTQGSGDKVRIEVEAAPPVRVHDAVRQAQNEVHAALDEVAEEFEALRGRPRKKKRRRKHKP